MKRIVRSLLAMTLLVNILGCGKKRDNDWPVANGSQDAKPATEMKLGEKTEALENVVANSKLPKPYLFGVQKQFSLTLSENTKVRIETESSAFGCDAGAKTAGPFVTLTTPDGKIVTNNSVQYADKVAAGLAAEVLKGVQKIQVDFYSDKECMAFGYTFKIAKDLGAITPTFAGPTPLPPISQPPVATPATPISTQDHFDRNLLGMWSNNDVSFKFDDNKQATMEVYFAGQIMFKMIQEVYTNALMSPKQVDLTVKEIPVSRGRSNFKVGEKIFCIYENTLTTIKIDCNKDAKTSRPTDFSNDAMVLIKKN